jgi:hypothetical protein
MTPGEFPLPNGTSVVILPSQVLLELEWAGLAGKHIVRLDQTLDGNEGHQRDEALANAVELFRNVVGLEIIEDALYAANLPLMNQGLTAAYSADPWERTKGI